MTINTKTRDVIVPKDLASRWELIVQEVSKRLFEQRKLLKTAIGYRPYKGLPVSEEEAYSRYVQVRADPQLLTELLASNLKVQPDGSSLLPRKLIERMSKFEDRYKKGTATVVEEPEAQPSPLGEEII